MILKVSEHSRGNTVPKLNSFGEIRFRNSIVSEKIKKVSKKIAFETLISRESYLSKLRKFPQYLSIILQKFHKNRQEFPQDSVDASTDSTTDSTRFCRCFYRFHKILSMLIEVKFKRFLRYVYIVISFDLFHDVSSRKKNSILFGNL